MSKYVVTWTFMRHIHWQREYKILTKIYDAKSEYFADFMMSGSREVTDLYNKSFDSKLKSITCIDDYIKPAEIIAIKPPIGVMPNQLWVEKRVHSVWGAVCRYKDAGRDIPVNWISELQTHITRLRSDITVLSWREIGYDIIEDFIFKK